MTDPKIVLDVRARIDDLKKKLNQAAAELAKLKQAGEKSASGIETLVSAFKTLIQSRIAQEAFKIATGLYNIAAAADRSTASLNRQSAGKADEYLEAVARATNEAVSETDALAASNKALALNVVSSAEEMEQLSRVAVALGRNTGRSATEALDDLVTGIGRASPLILDNVGIMISEAQVMEEANRLKLENANLSDTQAKKQATLNIVLQQGSDLLLDSRSTATDAATESERLAAAWTDFKVQVGESLIPMADLIGGIADLINQYNDLSKSTKERRQELLETAQTEEEYIALLGQNGFMTGHARQIMDAKEEWAEYRNELFNTMEEERAAAKIREQNAEAAADAAANAAEAEHKAALLAQQAIANRRDNHKELIGVLDEERHKLEEIGNATIKNDIFAGESLFDAIEEQTGQLQGLASVAGTSGGGFSEEDLKQYAWNRVKSKTDDPNILIPIARALGIMSEGEIAKLQELERIITLAAHGNLGADTFNAGLEALAAGDMNTVLGIRGNMGTTPTAGGGMSSSDPNSMFSKLANQYGGATGSGGNSGPQRVTVDFTGITSLDDIVLRSVAAGMNAALGGSSGGARKVGSAVAA